MLNIATLRAELQLHILLNVKRLPTALLCQQTQKDMAKFTDNA